jgi:2-keto-4-pentenoate hydratase
MRTPGRYSCVVVALMFPLIACAACPDEAAVAAYVADFQSVRISQGFGNDLSLADAECAKAKLAQKLPLVQGPVAGYKAAFTNPVVPCGSPAR